MFRCEANHHVRFKLKPPSVRIAAFLLFVIIVAVGCKYVHIDFRVKDAVDQSVDVRLL
jgi:hypothetical protein